MGLRAFGVLGLSVCASAVLASDNPANPTPLPGDITLGLPCDQALTFRKIITHEAGDAEAFPLLDDRRIRIGSSDVSEAYLDYLRDEFIAGAFTKDGSRFYLLGKYEITSDQYHSVMSRSGECPASGNDSSVPISSVSWYDATEFTRRLSHHLLQNGIAEVEALTGSPRFFVRLPTEAEWEFAARGGISVSLAEFQSTRYPMSGDILSHGWLLDPVIAQDEPQPIGLLEQNPLGLFDMYGNVSELMFEPFRLNKAGRAHGLAGGVILKGGAFLSSPASVTSAAREEISLYNDRSGEENRLRTTGFRVVLTGPALPTRLEVGRLIDEWKDLSQLSTTQGDDPIELIGQLRDEVVNLEMINNLDRIEQSIRAGSRGANESRERLLGGLLINAGNLVENIRNLKAENDNRNALLSGKARTYLGSDVNTIMNDIAEAEVRIWSINYFSHDTLVRIADEFDIDDINTAGRKIAGELRQRSLFQTALGVEIVTGILNHLVREQAEVTRERVLSFTLAN